MVAERDSNTDGFDRLSITDRKSSARMTVHVRPRSSKSRILGVRQGALDVAVSALPADGRANDELVRLLARLLDVRQEDVLLVTGTASRTKIVDVLGVDAATVRKRLAGAAR
jgi:uncharacterized protein (TIGR00251 family)